MKKIAIIGAGPAGLMAAASILEHAPQKTYHITIFERNSHPARKLLISGGGRCNITTGITEKKQLAQKYTRGFSFLVSSLGKFGPKKCREWFENHGVSTVCEEDGRIFPASHNGEDVL